MKESISRKLLKNWIRTSNFQWNYFLILLCTSSWNVIESKCMIDSISKRNLHATGWSKASCSEKDILRISSLLNNWNHKGRIADSIPVEDAKYQLIKFKTNTIHTNSMSILASFFIFSMKRFVSCKKNQYHNYRVLLSQS